MLCHYSLLLLDDGANASPGFSLGLSTHDRFYLLVETRVSFVSLPGRWAILAEEQFDFFDGLATRLGTLLAMLLDTWSLWLTSG